MNFENLCQICQEKSAPYKCPKCQVRYCSLKCYQDEFHGDCSQKFQENQLIENLDIDGPEDGEQISDTSNNFVRERIAEIFKRKLDEKEFHDENDDENVNDFFDEVFSRLKNDDDKEKLSGFVENDEEEDEDEEAEERIASDEEPSANLPDDFDESDENTKQMWNFLTDEEKQEFKSMLNDGRISHLLEDYKPWKPWWLFVAPSPKLINDVDENLGENLKFPDDVPKLNSNLVGLPSLTSILPHPNVRFDLFEIIFSYVLISVRYRSEFSSYLNESGNEFIQIVSRQIERPTIENQNESIETLRNRIFLLRQFLQEKFSSLRISEQFFLQILSDVRKIVHGPFPRAKSSNEFVLAALSDLSRFLVQIQHEKPIEKCSKLENRNVFHFQREKTKKNDKIKSNSKIILKISRKIDYFLSWSVTHSDRLRILEQEIEFVFAELSQKLSDYQKEKIQIEKNIEKLRLQKSNKIEEL